jgi:hypothetical protein
MLVLAKFKTPDLGLEKAGCQIHGKYICHLFDKTQTPGGLGSLESNTGKSRQLVIIRFNRGK